MAYSFTASTNSQLVTSLTTHSTQRSYAFWTKRLDAAEGSEGHIFDKGTGSAGGGLGAITFDAVAQQSDAVTWNHTIDGSAGDNRMLMVMLGHKDSNAINYVRYNGVTATLAVDNVSALEFDGVQVRTHIYYLLDANLPASSGTYSVEVSPDTLALDDHASISLLNVKQEPPYNPKTDSGSAAGWTELVHTVTGSGHWMVDYMYGNVTATAHPNQTVRVNNAGGTVDCYLSTREVNAGSATMAWNAQATLFWWSHTGVVVAPVNSDQAVSIDALYNKTSTYEYQRAKDGQAGKWSFDRPGTGTWAHIAVVYDGSGADAPTIYVDGSSVGVTTISAPTGALLTNATAYVIGNTTAADKNWGGYLAEGGVWDRLLTEGEVKALAAGLTPLALPVSLVSYIPMIR